MCVCVCVGVRVRACVCVCVYLWSMCGCSIASRATRDMQSQHVVIARGPHYATCITFLLYGAACPSSLSSLTMGEIDLLVSQIPASVFFFE